MSIPHRILTPDDPSKPFSKALTESDSSEDYATAQSSMADVSIVNRSVKPLRRVTVARTMPRHSCPWQM